MRVLKPTGSQSRHKVQGRRVDASGGVQLEAGSEISPGCTAILERANQLQETGTNDQGLRTGATVE